jgi:hypothetical protein
MDDLSRRLLATGIVEFDFRIDNHKATRLEQINVLQGIDLLRNLTRVANHRLAMNQVRYMSRYCGAIINYVATS